LLSILVPSSKNTEMISKVKDVVISDPGGSAARGQGYYMLMVNFKDAKTLPEIITISSHFNKVKA
jgi:hypothetical protein